MKNFFKKLIVLLIMVLAATAFTGCVKPDDSETKSPATDVPTTNVVTYEYKLNKTSLSLEEGQTDQLSVTVTPQKEVAVTYESSNSSVASVSADGVVTALAAGTATITAKVDEEELTCSVTVTAKPVEYEYTLNFTTMTLEVESTKKLIVFVDPDKDITPTYESSDSAVATVAADGTIKDSNGNKIDK